MKCRGGLPLEQAVHLRGLLSQLLEQRLASPLRCRHTLSLPNFTSRCSLPKLRQSVVRSILGQSRDESLLFASS